MDESGAVVNRSKLQIIIRSQNEKEKRALSEYQACLGVRIAKEEEYTEALRKRDGILWERREFETNNYGSAFRAALRLADIDRFRNRLALFEELLTQQDETVERLKNELIAADEALKHAQQQLIRSINRTRKLNRAEELAFKSEQKQQEMSAEIETEDEIISRFNQAKR